MAWRIAESLETLRKQLNAAFPNRSKASDSGIGDEKHASRSSDHNPWVKDRATGKGVVTARDFTHDPQTGIDCNWLADELVRHRDPRIKYIIWNKKICSSKTSPWQWRPYKGVNAHRHHLHISVTDAPGLYDSTKPWVMDFPDDEGDDVATISAAAPADQPIVSDESAVVPVPDSPSQPQAASAIFNTGDAATPPPSGDPVKVKTERTSIWAKIGVGIGVITGAGINLWSMIETKLNEMTVQQVGYVIGALALIAVTLWLYDRAQKRAHEKTLAKVDTASDPSKNTVELSR
jgi:hypothetical protein